MPLAVCGILASPAKLQGDFHGAENVPMIRVREADERIRNTGECRAA